MDDFNFIGDTNPAYRRRSSKGAVAWLAGSAAFLLLGGLCLLASVRFSGTTPTSRPAWQVTNPTPGDEGEYWTADDLAHFLDAAGVGKYVSGSADRADIVDVSIFRTDTPRRAAVFAAQHNGLSWGRFVLATTKPTVSRAIVAALTTAN